MAEREVIFLHTYLGEYMSVEDRHLRRMSVAANLARLLEHTIRDGLINKIEPPENALAFERNQRQHIVRYMKLPQNPNYSDFEHKCGSLVDKNALALCDCIRAWEGIGKARRGAQYRRHRAHQVELERQQRLAERRERRVQQETSGLPQTHHTKREKHEQKEQCEKCHKRPAVRDHLCGQCLDWERAKLGRE